MDELLNGLMTSKRRTVILRIVGSLLGLVVGCVSLGSLGLLLFYLLNPYPYPDSDNRHVALLLFPTVGALIGAGIGAAIGASTIQMRLKQRASSWRTLMVTAIGMFLGAPGVILQVLGTPGAIVQIGIPFAVILMIAAAVIGSAWQTKPKPGFVLVLLGLASLLCFISISLCGFLQIIDVVDHQYLGPGEAGVYVGIGFFGGMTGLLVIIAGLVVSAVQRK